MTNATTLLTVIWLNSNASITQTDNCFLHITIIQNHSTEPIIPGSSEAPVTIILSLFPNASSGKVKWIFCCPAITISWFTICHQHHYYNCIKTLTQTRWSLSWLTGVMKIKDDKSMKQKLHCTRGVQKVFRLTVNHKICTSYFVVFQHNLLQLECTWSNVSPKLRFCGRKIVHHALQTSHVPCC